MSEENHLLGQMSSSPCKDSRRFEGTYRFRPYVEEDEPDIGVNADGNEHLF
jgi:hypothetical protein